MQQLVTAAFVRALTFTRSTARAADAATALVVDVDRAAGAGMQDIPEEIVYIPDGRHTLTPSVNGQPREITVSIPAGKGAQIAAALQAALEQRLSQNVRPHVAFDHVAGRAAGIPQSFRYVAGQGILLRLSWTTSGREAVAGRDYSYFSPAFLIDAHGVPCGLPARGEIGSLVNEPAFRSIRRIAASSHPSLSNKNIDTPHPMSEKVLAALGIDPAHDGAEDSAVASVQALLTDSATLKTLEASHAAELHAICAERDALRACVDAAELAAEQKRRAEGEELHRRAVACGIVPPANERRKNEIVRAALDGNDFALCLIRELVEAAERDPRRNPATPIVRASAAAAGAPQKPRDLNGLEAVEAALAAELRD